jgi:hypothetical protein
MERPLSAAKSSAHPVFRLPQRGRRGQAALGPREVLSHPWRHRPSQSGQLRPYNSCNNPTQTCRGTTVLRWRTWIWLIAVAAVGPTVLWASPFGPARNLAHAALLLLAYPYWFLFSLVCLVPGVSLIRRFALNGWWVLPCTAVLIEIAIGAVRHWPPTSWGPAEIIFLGPTPPPFNYWYFYLYSLWPDAFMGLVSALMLLPARHFFLPKSERKAAIDLTTQQPD